MPLSTQNLLKCLEINSPPLFKRKTIFSFQFGSQLNSYIEWNKWKHHTSFVKGKYVHLEKLSIKIRKYNAPPSEGMLMGPHMFVWIRVRDFVAWVDGSMEYSNRCCFLKVQSTHNGRVDWNGGSRVINSWVFILLKYLELKCPRRKCHLSVSSSDIIIAT
jgi:hypothetical protein